MHGVSAALEFAVQNLNVKYIIVMGHSHCGGVRAFVEHRGRPDPGDFIDNWMSLITPVAQSLGDDKYMSRSDYLARLEADNASPPNTINRMAILTLWLDSSRLARSETFARLQ
jgi:carbonic anhydrase